MDNDDNPPTRPSTAHDRPTRAPSGPRIRTRPRHPGMGPPSADSPASPTLDSPSALPFPAPSPSPQPPTPQKTPTATFVPPPPLTPPPAISFESTPIPWKGLPLDAAQWTFSSSELQEIVSKAIRLSARDSFVRLLSLQALEVDIVHESDRLDAERLAAQSKWRFEAGRRTMLMQALNACAAFSAPGTDDDPIPAFVAQLASSIKSCDTLLSTIFHISDQQSQIALIQHQHWASALGMALRKLNSAHERQAEELKRAQARVQTLEDELEEAWREAEKMAVEFDDLEQEIAESVSDQASEDVVQEVAVYADPRPDYLDPKQDPDETGTLGDVTIHTDIAVVLGVTATAVASKATLVTSPASPKFADKSDTRSIKSTRSRRDGPSHLSRLSSARVRSRAASNASLRLPKALRSPSTHTSPVDTPPIPALPPASVQGDSFLDMESIITNEPSRKVLPPQRPYCPSLSRTHADAHPGHPEPTLALPVLPHSAGLPVTRVPSIWLETDAGKSTHLNGLDRSHSFHLFSSLTAKKARRSNLVMSLAGSDRSSDGCMSTEMGMGTGTASPTSNNSPVSLPTHALARFRGASCSSSDASHGDVARPGSAGARLTTTTTTDLPVPVGSPRRSLVSRASSVILRRLSQATVGRGGRATPGPAPSKGIGSPARLREASRLVERWREDGEGEVMLIGPHADPFDAP